jgi:DNA-binding transcriptional LysR family regulator
MVWPVLRRKPAAGCQRGARSAVVRVVTEEFRVSRAARRLFVAQRALSREIQRPEERIGRPIFTRTTRQVTLTGGSEAARDARRLLALHD